MKKIILLLLVTATGLSSCKKEEVDNTTYKIEYAVNCERCDVSYVSDQSGQQTTGTNKNSDWAYSFVAKKGQDVLLFANNTSNTPQSITTTIKLNGEILTTKTTYCPISGISFCQAVVK